MHDLNPTENNTTHHQQTAGGDFLKFGATGPSATPIAVTATPQAPDFAATISEPPAPVRRKCCRTCGSELPITEFYRQRNCLDSHRPDCKSCIAARNERRRQRTAEESALRETLMCKECHETKPLADFVPDSRYHRGCRSICTDCHAVEKAVSGAPDLNLPDNPRRRPSAGRIELGLAIAEATCPPGHCRSCEEIAAFTGLTEDAVRKIEQRALAKLRRAAERLLRKLAADKMNEEEQP